MKSHTLKAARRTLLVAAASAAVLAAVAAPAMAGRWVTGDIHTHTYLSDGSSTFVDVSRNAFSVYGLDYLANCDHGGTSAKDPGGVSFEAAVPRWLTLSNYSFPTVLDARATYPERRVIQGIEWNAPTHEHVSVGVVGAGNEPRAISDFEYHFDQNDTDLSRVREGTKAVKDSKTGEIFIPAMPFIKNNVTHEDMIVGVDWLRAELRLRELRDRQPSVAQEPVARRGLPRAERRRPGRLLRLRGHARPPGRRRPRRVRQHHRRRRQGHGDPALADPTLTSHARTYGGADWMTATVGGLWDALLGEGRNWWVFNNSDYHVVNTSYKDAAGTTIGLEYKDFWPGQYAKTYTYVNRMTDQGRCQRHALRQRRSSSTATSSTRLKFSVTDGTRTADHGRHAEHLRRQDADRHHRRPFAQAERQRRSGAARSRRLIAGEVTGIRIDPRSNPAYIASETNPSTKVAKTFSKSSLEDPARLEGHDVQGQGRQGRRTSACAAPTSPRAAEPDRRTGQSAGRHAGLHRLPEPQATAADGTTSSTAARRTTPGPTCGSTATRCSST